MRHTFDPRLVMGADELRRLAADEVRDEVLIDRARELGNEFPERAIVASLAPTGLFCDSRCERLVRRAAQRGEVWAMVAIGLDIDVLSTEAEPPRFSRAEALTYLDRAATAGHRTASLAWAYSDEAGDDPNLARARAIVAYGSGTASQSFHESDVPAAALIAARWSAITSRPDTRAWFERALEPPDWEAWTTDGFGLSWVEAAWSFMHWLHEHGHFEPCLELGRRVAAEAVRHGARDRDMMRGEHKHYRADYLMPSGREGARYRALEHLLASHQLPPEEAWEVARVVALGDSDTLSVERLAGLPLARLAADVGATTTEVLHAAGSVGPHRPLVAQDAWDALDWLIGEVVPVFFVVAGQQDAGWQMRDWMKSLAGAGHGDMYSFARLEDFTIHGSPLWAALEPPKPAAPPHRGRRGELAPPAAGPSIDTRLHHLLDDVGLGPTASTFDPSQRWACDKFGGKDWGTTARVWRGSDAWIALYATLADEAGTWARQWDAASTAVWIAARKVLELQTIADAPDGGPTAEHPAPAVHLVSHAIRETYAAFLDRIHA